MSTPAQSLEARGLLLPPALRARLADITIRSRQPTHAGRLGQQASRSRGSGTEFAQYRTYEPGDDLRQLDWKLFGRSDRYFVREAERDSPLTLWLLLDTTGSMDQADAARPQWTRLHAARRLAACAIEIALRQGDAFGVLRIGSHGADGVPAGAGPRQRDRCLHAMAGFEAAGEWPDQARLRPLLEQLRADAVVLLLSDLFDDRAIEFVERLAGAGRDVASVQLITADERDFRFDGACRFVDAETGAIVECDATTARAGFVARFDAARRELASRLAARGVRHAEHAIDGDDDAPLRRLFPSRLSR